MDQSEIRVDATPADLSRIAFHNSFVSVLPADPDTHIAPRAVRNACYSRVAPTPVRAPQLLAWSEAVGESLGLAPPRSSTGIEAEVLGGNRVLPGMQPYAARYGGHQFGVWAGQLGDGRAITLAEIAAPNGSRQELQLKGAGITPYSRSADGRAVLRSSLREYLCSEAMFYLGVPTTRALSLVATGEAVVRDMFYDGRPRPEPGAIVSRVAPSFVRFGNFQILAAHREHDELKRLADYVITTHFPELGAPSPAIYAQWFEEICRRTAHLIAHWMRVGFVHGVMNTDNMSILGLTIDYGPYGWLEGYDPYWTPNTTDNERHRYCYGRQPEIAQWNLLQLANALFPLINDKAPLEQALETYGITFNKTWGRMLGEKLGLGELDQTGDEALLNNLFEVLQAAETDMTIFFRRLARAQVRDAEGLNDEALIAPLAEAFYSEDAQSPAHASRVAAWLRQYADRASRCGISADERAARMNRVNPKYVPRNYLAQLAIDALEQRNDVSVLERLMTVMQRPYDEQPEHEDLAVRRPEWARNRAGCSALSCSS